MTLMKWTLILQSIPSFAVQITSMICLPTTKACWESNMNLPTFFLRWSVRTLVRTIVLRMRIVSQSSWFKSIPLCHMVYTLPDNVHAVHMTSRPFCHAIKQIWTWIGIVRKKKMNHYQKEDPTSNIALITWSNFRCFLKEPSFSYFSVFHSFLGF